MAGDSEQDRLFLRSGRVRPDRDRELDLALAVVFNQARPPDRIADVAVVVIERHGDPAPPGHCHRVGNRDIGDGRAPQRDERTGPHEDLFPARGEAVVGNPDFHGRHERRRTVDRLGCRQIEEIHRVHVTRTGDGVEEDVGQAAELLVAARVWVLRLGVHPCRRVARDDVGGALRVRVLLVDEPDAHVAAAPVQIHANEIAFDVRPFARVAESSHQIAAEGAVEEVVLALAVTLEERGHSKRAGRPVDVDRRESDLLGELQVARAGRFIGQSVHAVLEERDEVVLSGAGESELAAGRRRSADAPLLEPREIRGIVGFNAHARRFVGSGELFSSLPFGAALLGRRTLRCLRRAAGIRVELAFFRRRAGERLGRRRFRGRGRRRARRLDRGLNVFSLGAAGDRQQTNGDRQPGEHDLLHARVDGHKSSLPSGHGFPNPSLSKPDARERRGPGEVNPRYIRFEGISRLVFRQ